MTPERFAELADAFGGEIRRWPVAEQAAARAFAEAEPMSAYRLLDDAGSLDAILNEVERLQPSAALRQRVLDQAPQPGAMAALQRRIGGLSAIGRWLAPGAGLAAACAAGAWLGVAATHAAEAKYRAETVLVASADQAAADQVAPGGGL
jgi:hypothetical protein